ncbi:MAG: NAD(P)-dependent oxidoreductase, partial [Salinirussus sp.]
GFPLSQIVREAGHPVVAYDVREDALDAFAESGGEVAESPAAVARMCRSVHVVVVTDEQAEAVVFGEDGIFAGFEASDGGLLVVHSTVTPDTVEKFSDRAPEGVAVIDAAMSGGSERAEVGDIALMVGGDEDIVDWYRPVLEPMGREVFYLGPVGSGLAAKLANNLALHVTMAGTFEAIDLAGAYGVSEDDLLAVMEQSTGDSYFVRHFDFLTREYLETHPAGPYAMARNSRKNLMQALALGESVGEALPMAGIASQLVPETYTELADDMREED